MTAPALGRWAASPPRLLTVLAVCWLFALLAIYSDAGVGLFGIFTLLIGGVGLGVSWVIRRTGFVLARRSRSVGPQGAWWPVLPACLGVATILALWFEPPANFLFQWRFSASEPALLKAAATLAAGGKVQASAQPGWIGLFSVKRIESHDGQVRFITADCGVVDSCGVIYSPSGPPSRWMEDRFSHLRGPWWHLYEGF